MLDFGVTLISGRQLKMKLWNEVNLTSIGLTIKGVNANTLKKRNYLTVINI
jgi:hypothetical protein